MEKGRGKWMQRKCGNESGYNLTVALMLLILACCALCPAETVYLPSLSIIQQELHTTTTLVSIARGC